MISCIDSFPFDKRCFIESKCHNEYKQKTLCLLTWEKTDVYFCIKNLYFIIHSGQTLETISKSIIKWMHKVWYIHVMELYRAARMTGNYTQPHDDSHNYDAVSGFFPWNEPVQDARISVTYEEGGPEGTLMGRKGERGLLFLHPGDGHIRVFTLWNSSIYILMICSLFWMCMRL